MTVISALSVNFSDSGILMTLTNELIPSNAVILGKLLHQIRFAKPNKYKTL